MEEIVIKQPNETNTFIFNLPEEEAIIKISPDGFFYKGEKVEDVHNVYERFNDWLKKAEVTKTKEVI